MAIKPFLSIVSGTYNRLDYLRAMCDSVRKQLPPGFPYEIILVDGGSTDGTLDWCAAQPDVKLIAQGKLLGAIRAFDAGCEAAEGEFVLIANDDILVHQGAIVRALTHLMRTPACGAVAFMDDRKAPGYNTDALKVQTIQAMQDGHYTNVVYAQVGLFRSALGEKAGWWGSRDSLMGEFHTYGGDAYLSARLWEMGYTVEAVEGVACTDRVAPDQLRQKNHDVEQRIGSAYYRRYPNGVVLPNDKAEPSPEQLRILYLPLFSPGFGRYKTGLFDALAAVGRVYELDYVRYHTALPSAVAAFQPHLILTQFHDANTVPPQTLAYARTFAPEAVVVNWNGDCYLDQLTAPDMLALLRHVDLQLVVNADALPIYEARGIQAAYWQISAEPVPDELPPAKAHDVLFMANAYSPARKELAAVLLGLSENVGIYGTGWDKPSGNSFYDFAQGASLYRNCKIAIGDNQWQDKGFVSNRFFEATANGAFLLHQTIPGMEALTGYVEGVHYVGWRDYADLRVKVRYYLEHEDERRRIAEAGEKFTREQHSFDERVRQLFEELLPRIQPNDTGRQRTHDSGEAVADMEQLASEYGWLDRIPR